MPPGFHVDFFIPSFVISGISRTAASRCRLHSSTHPPQRCSNDYRDISVTSACGIESGNVIETHEDKGDFKVW